MNELKKCPFCGGEAFFAKAKQRDGNVMYETISVICSECGCKTEEKICDGYYDCYCTDEEIAEIWNIRKPAEEVLARLEEESDYWLELYDVQWKKGFIDSYADGFFDGCEKAIEIVKEGMG